MSSYHQRSILPPPRRSATSAVTAALRNVARPRSSGYLPSSGITTYNNPYATLAGHSYSTGSPSVLSSYLSSSPSTSSYHSSASSSLPYHSSSSSNAYHHASPSSASSSLYSSLSPNTYKSNYSRPISSRRSPSRFSGLGSRSGSTSSLSALSTKSEESEGYASEGKSRLGSSASLASSQPEENGEVDYKKLYEEEHAVNERLRETLRRTEDELTQVKSSKTPLSEMEKRERRAMERKLSEMEEELKVLETLKAENQRLKDENGALIRVISKLSK